MVSTKRDIYRFDEFQLDPASRILSRHGEQIPVYPKAFEILTYLVNNPGRVVAKDEIVRAVWPESFVEEGNLARQISSLRRALGDRSGCIVTIPGRGYQLAVRVEPAPQPDSSTATQTGDVAGDILVQRVRERTQVVIEESFPVIAPVRIPLFRRMSRGMALWTGLGLVLLVSGAALLWKRSLRPPQLRKVVVAGFVDTTGDAGFNRIFKRALEIDLGQSPYIDVMSDGEALSTLRLMGRTDDSPLTPEIARELCERSNRQVVLSGDIAQLGGEYLVTLEATGCVSGKRLFGATAHAASREKVLPALDSLAERVRSGLGEPSRSLESYQVPIQMETTASFEALKAFSMGIDMQLHGKDETESLPFFQRAVEADPQFAMAYGAIGSDYYNLGEYTLARNYYKKAFDLSGPVSAKEKLILKAHYYAEGLHDLSQGIDTYREWANIYPNDWVPWANMADGYIQMGEYPQAVAAGEHALRIEPNRSINYSVLIRAYRRANRFTEAKSLGQTAIQRQMDAGNLHGSLYQIATVEHDADARARETKWAAEHSEGWYGVFFLALQAEEYATEGRYRNSEAAFRRAWETAEREKMVENADGLLLDQALIELRFGQFTAARATLGRVHKIDPDAPEVPLLQAALGNMTLAQAFLNAHSAETDPGTLMTFVYLPRVRAALARQRRRLTDEIDALEPASPYELIDYAIPFDKAAAYMEEKRPDLAVTEFQKIVSNPGIDPVSILYPLAHLGLARACALEGNKAGSKSAYERFFALWNDADPDLPALQQARREYARLQ